MNSLTSAFRVGVSIVISVAGIAVATGQDCTSAKSAYHSGPSLISATDYIRCFEGPSDGGNLAQSDWWPQNPGIGDGPVPVPPSAQQLRDFMRRFQATYSIPNEDWAAATQLSLVPSDTKIWVNSNVLILPLNNDLPLVDSDEPIEINDITRVRPNYLDGLQIGNLQDFDMGRLQ